MSEEKRGNGDGGSNFALTVRRAAQLPAQAWPDERIAVVARTVAPDGASASEVAMFLAVANRYNLDPFAREIWLVKDKGRLIIVTGKDAILKVARSSQEDYQGFEAGAVRAKDAFAAVRKGGDVAVSHEIQGFDRGELLGAYCLARKKGHPPVLIMRRWDEYTHLQHKENWKNYPEDMLISRVVTAAHRLLYNISGMYTQEEIDSGEAAEALDSHEVAQKTRDRLEELKASIGGPGTSDPTPAEDGPPIVDAEIVEEEEPEAKPGASAEEHNRARGRFWALYHELGYDSEVVEQEKRRHDWLAEHFGSGSFADLTTDQVITAIVMLEKGEGPELPEAAAAGQGGGMPA